MLVRFTVSNFLSFKEPIEFNMLTGNPRRLEHHVYELVKGLELLKMAAVYGANGAGKSNLVKAMDYFRDLIVTGDWDTPMKRKFRMDKECQVLPATFELEFVHHGKVYVYGADIFDDYIGEEWLYESGLGADDTRLFHRYTTKEDITRIEMADRFIKVEEDRYRIKFYAENELKGTQLFFWKIAETKGVFEEIKHIFEWIQDKWLIVFPHSRPAGLLKGLIEDKEFSAFAQDLITSFKTGIQKISVEKKSFTEFFGADDMEMSDKLHEELMKPENKSGIGLRSPQGREELYAVIENGKPIINKLVTNHKDAQGNTYEFVPREESDGTQRLLDLIPALYKAVRDDVAVIIDEIDQSIHPLLLKEIVRKFSSDEKTEGQLIFTTHEAHLLDQALMRQDEFWFAEKNQSGETKFIPLSEYKDVRYDLDLRKGYFNGRFSAIPYLGELKRYKWTEHVKETEQSL